MASTCWATAESYADALDYANRYELSRYGILEITTGRHR